MDLFFEQLPVVLGALNTGFIQTLKLFFVTLLGAFPLGLLIALGSMSKFKPLSYLMKFIVWIVRGTPLMIQLLIIYYFPGLVFHNPVWGGGEGGRFVAASVSFIVNYACYFSEIYRGGIQGIPVGQEEAGLVHDSKADILQGQAFADDKEDSSGDVQRDHNSGQGYVPCPYHRTSGDNLGRTGIHEGFTGNLWCDMATLLLRILLSDMEWRTHSFTWQIREET